MSPSPIRFSITAGTLTRALGCIAALLVIANCGVIFLRVKFGMGWLFGMRPLFDLDTESNLPSLFSTLLFLLNAVLLFCIGRIQPDTGTRSARIPWFLLAAVFGFLGLDECVSLHEICMVVVRKALDVGGVFHFAWIIPYGLATGVLALFLAPWFLRLDRRTQIHFGGSAAIFLGGAIGMEMIAGSYLEASSLKRDLPYQVMYTIEETLEMTGLIFFAYGLMDFLRRHQGVTISFDLSRSASSTTPGDPVEVVEATIR